MSTFSWREPAFALVVVAFCGASGAWAQSRDRRPNDATTGVTRAAEDPDSKVTGVEQDDATARLLWERQAWGVVTPTFRTSALREGRKHSDRKNADNADTAAGDEPDDRSPRWVSIGPLGADFEQNGSFTGHVRDSGRARTILPHPTNPDVVYFLTSGGGLWRTNNWRSAQTEWTPLTDDLPTTGGGSVAFGLNPNTLYLGLGDPYDQILVGGAMVKSTDGGASWQTMIELGSAVSVRDVKVDTRTIRDIVLVATDSGLYRSADGGNTYSAVSTFAGQSVWSIVRTSAGWLASAQPCPVASVGLRCGLASTLYLSTDRGATWAPIPNTGNVFTNNGRTTLAVAVPGEAVVYAYSSNVADTAMQDVYRSADGGRNWVANGVNATKIPTNPVTGASTMNNMNICHAQCWYNQMILVDPQDALRNTVWIGGDLGTARTPDGGTTWTIQTWWLYSQVPELRYAHADHHTAAFKATGTPSIILGNDGGLHVSEDNGVTFSSDKNNGLATHLYYTVAGNAQFPNLVIGGTQDNGTRLRTDNGGIHNQVIGGDGMGTTYSLANTNTVLGSAQGSSMRTNLTNNPPTVFQNWAAATAGLSDVGFGFFTAIVPAPGDATGRVFFHFSNARVWKTVNGGLSWTMIGSTIAPISPGFPPLSAVRRFRSSPYNLGVSPTDANRIAIGAAGGFLDITTDGGASWTDLDLITRVPGYQGFVTNVTWQDNQTMWITAVAQAPGSVRVIKATIASPTDSWTTATFTPRQNGLPDLPVTRVLVDPRDATGNTIYAATHVGIYRTGDGGASWAIYGKGLPTVRVNDIYMPPDGGFMRIATYGRGMWELPQLELVRTALTDDDTCDDDGVLDNGEEGDLAITLKNQGANDLHFITLTVTSSNPHVTFPQGNRLFFGGVPKYGESTASIRVALNGAAGIEAADFQIAIEARELGLPSGLRVMAAHRVNYDERPAVSAADSVEATGHGWAIDGDATTSPNIAAWQRRALSPIQNLWSGPDNNGQADGEKLDLPDEQVLVSPTMQVGSGPLDISFQHRFSFEGGNWDGGVVEISTNGGATWSDIGTGAYNGSTNGVTSAPIGINRPAFVNRMTGWPAFTTVTLNLGLAYANQAVKIRFRIGADESTGAPGWDIDNINVTGITNTPFSALVANTTVCAQATSAASTRRSSR